MGRDKLSYDQITSRNSRGTKSIDSTATKIVVIASIERRENASMLPIVESAKSKEMRRDNRKRVHTRRKRNERGRNRLENDEE